MNESVFWQVIESAWATYPALDKTRQRAAALNQSDALQQLAIMLEQVVIPAIGLKLMELDREGLTDFIRTLEAKMHQLDRAVLYQQTSLSDLCFIHARALIIGMGKQYFNLIDQDPAKATRHLEAEYVTTIGYKIYEERFGRPIEKFAKHSILTGSNKAAWVQGGR